MLYDLAMFWNSCRKMKNHLRFHSKWWDSTASAKPCFRDTASSDALFRAPQHWPRANAKQEEWRQKYDNVSRKGRKNRKKQWFITHATCAVFVAFWFPWLQMTKPAHSPRIWSNYTVDAPEILHTHSWYNINYAVIILRSSFALLDMLRAAIWSLCFALSFHFCLPQFLFPSLWLPLFAPSRRQRCPLLGLWKETTQLQTFSPQHFKPCFRVSLPLNLVLYIFHG